MRAIGIWGRWRSERQAAEYVEAPLDWVCGALPTLPWPGAGGGVQYKATGVMDMWPMGTIFGVANGADQSAGRNRTSSPTPPAQRKSRG